MVYMYTGVNCPYLGGAVPTFEVKYSSAKKKSMSFPCSLLWWHTKSTKTFRYSKSFHSIFLETSERAGVFLEAELWTMQQWSCLFGGGGLLEQD